MRTTANVGFSEGLADTDAWNNNVNGHLPAFYAGFRSRPTGKTRAQIHQLWAHLRCDRHFNGALSERGSASHVRKTTGTLKSEVIS